MEERVKIVQGTDRKIIVRLEDKIGDAWDLTEVDEVTACFKLADGTRLEKTLTGGGIEIVNNKPMNGKIAIFLTDTDTQLMKVSDPLKKTFSSFEVILDDTNAGDTQIVQFKDALEIIKRLC
jgi:hypothetical protein